MLRAALCRRGVIRDVLPEQTPVPVIAARPREKAGDLLEAEQRPTGTPAPNMTPTTIIEVPRWLTQLETNLSASPKAEQTESLTASVRVPMDCRETPSPAPLDVHAEADADNVPVTSCQLNRFMASCSLDARAIIPSAKDRSCEGEHHHVFRDCFQSFPHHLSSNPSRSSDDRRHAR